MTENRPVPVVRRELEALGVPFGRWAVVDDAAAAAEAAERIGYPVVAKIVSDAVVHKTDAGLVEVGIADAAELGEVLHRMSGQVRSISGSPSFQILIEQMSAGERELLLGVRRDEVFGSVVVVGLGGVDVEVHDDVSIRIAPIADAEVHEMFRELRSAPLLLGHRNRCPVDLDAVVPLVRALVGHLEADDRIVDIEINPIIARCKGDGAVAVDARVTVIESEDGASLDA